MLAQGKRVLVIDEEPGIREIVQTNLEAEGYSVVTANSGAAGLKVINEKHPDLVILEVMLPDMNDWEVLERVTSDPESAGTPFILVTTRTGQEDFVKGLEMGAIDYVTKPFDPVRLTALVKRVLKESERRVWEARRRQLAAQARLSVRPQDTLS